MDRLKEKEGGEVSVKTRVEIFGESFPDLVKAGVHAASNEGDGVTWIGAVEVEDFQACLPHVAGDSDILDHMVSDRFMAFDLVV